MLFKDSIEGQARKEISCESESFLRRKWITNMDGEKCFCSWRAVRLVNARGDEEWNIIFVLLFFPSPPLCLSPFVFDLRLLENSMLNAEVKEGDILPPTIHKLMKGYNKYLRPFFDSKESAHTRSHRNNTALKSHKVCLAGNKVYLWYCPIIPRWNGNEEIHAEENKQTLVQHG